MSRFDSSKRLRLGEQLLRLGVITNEQLQEALAEAKSAGLRIGECLVRKGIVSERQILEIVSDQMGIPMYRPEEFPLNPALKSLIAMDVAQRSHVVPLCIKDNVLNVALLDAFNFNILDSLEDLIHREIEPVLCLPQEFVSLFTAVYGQYSAFNKMLKEFEDTAPAGDADSVALVESNDEVISTTGVGTPDGVPVIRLMNLILSEGVQAGASDIHINPEKSLIRVRYRVEGLLRNASEVPLAMGPSLVSRIKIMGNMDISVTRIPQDGRFTVMIDKREINVRVSTLPTTYGENIVMRLLDVSSQRVYSFARLGMNAHDAQVLEQCARKPYGMILSTGPTGSGKSSSLYAIIQLIKRDDVNIITLEDPVEYRMEGVRQVQLNAKAGMTFASGLRSILRQDPDILMVGEIRDEETANIAVQSALTGHLVLSTLHTNDALSAVYRLMDMGIESYLVSSVLLCTFAQRLVRTVCPHCRTVYEPAPGLLSKFGLREQDGPFYHGTGCTQCGGTGYQGRIGIFEVLPMTEELQQAVSDRVSMPVLRKMCMDRGLRTMADDAADKIRAGLTTVEEALRVTMA